MLGRWWNGARGEWYVAAQAALFLLIIFGPRAGPGRLWGALPYAWLVSVIGGGLLAVGGLLAGAGAFGLGKNLTPLPRPRENAALVQSGAYRIVRHPIYGGLIMMVWGWGLAAQDWLLLGYAVLTFIFFDLKSRREERWLQEKFPGYGDYRTRVRKLLPFLY